MPDLLPNAELLKETLAVLSDLIPLVDTDRKIRFMSRPEAGYRREEVVGREPTVFAAPAAREELAELLDRVFETMEPAQQLTEIVNADGTSEWYEGTMIPLVQEGRVAWVVIVTKNVTARLAAQRELEMLHRLLPVCASCRKVRTQEGEWRALEAYLEEASDRRVTHGICPDCERTMLSGGEQNSA